MLKTERRQSMAERRPSALYTPSVIPHLAGLEKPQDHSLKLDQCDVLILGTGLTESILAAALSWQGVEVLHIDSASVYGDHLLTLTIDQMKKWLAEVNQGKVRHFHDAQVYIPGGKHTNKFNSKDYGIDLSPKVMFAKLDLLLLLVKLRVYKYLEFQSLLSFHVFENDDFSKNILAATTASTKGDIFTDQLLSLHTKRYLMRFLKFALQDSSDEGKLKLMKEYADSLIEDFLRDKFKLDTPQVNELIFLIGLCNKAQVPTPEALLKIRRFLMSFDVYGKFPVMVLKYGGPGEISQGFCRSAAVAGTTYKLNTLLVDFDPQLKVAKFNDGLQVKINEKIVISPTQVPKFLSADYQDLITRDVDPLRVYSVTRLILVVKKDCEEWMTENESLAIVVFPPGSLPTSNAEAVQVIVQNGHSGVCPEGQSIWYLHTTEQNIARAKDDLQAAFDKMEMSIVRELSLTDLEDVLDDKDFMVNEQGTPVLVNSFKLGKLLQNFVPREKLEIVCKIGFVQETLLNPNLSNVVNATADNNVTLAACRNSEDVIFTNMPSSELSYDGVVSDCKLLFQRITGTDEDFFDVDFEDDDEDEEGYGGAGANGLNDGSTAKATTSNENAIADSDEDVDHHEPFGANEMEL